MPHSDPLPPDVLDVIATQLGDRLSSQALKAAGEGTVIALAETLPVWVLGLDATSQAEVNIESVAVATGVWHHQIRFGPDAKEFARSLPRGPKAEDWEVQDVTGSEIAANIQRALEWIIANVHDGSSVRLLIVPAYYMHCLWLQSERGSYIVLADRPDAYTLFEYSRLYSSEEFLDALRRTQHATGIPLSPPLL
jgi:hypothetical protein